LVLALAASQPEHSTGSAGIFRRKKLFLISDTKCVFGFPLPWEGGNPFAGGLAFGFEFRVASNQVFDGPENLSWIATHPF
jgi:hypothetical protein